jgi:hypothetical protein
MGWSLFKETPALPLMMTMMISRETSKFYEINFPKCHFIHHTPDTDYPSVEASVRNWRLAKRVS